MKKVFTLIVAFLIFLGSLTGCQSVKDGNNAASSDSSVKEQEKISLRFMYWNKEESMQALLDLIAEKLPSVELEYQYVDTTSFQTVYKTQMNAGEGPDILSIENVNSEVAAGYCLDLTDYDFVSNYQKSVLNSLAVDGKTYCIPGPSWFGGYFYNKGMFEEQGWSIPATWEEFLALCDTIAAAGIKPIANPIKNPNYLMQYALGYVTPQYLRQEAGMTWDKDYAAGTVKMADLLPYFESWAKIVEKGYVNSDDLGTDYDQALDEFVTGKAAIFDSGPWDVETIYSKNPEIQIDMMPFVGSTGEGWLFGGPGIRFGINSSLGKEGNEEKLAAAAAVLEVISSEEGQLAYWQNNQGGSSYIKGVELKMGKEYDGCTDVFAAGNVYAPWQQWNAGVYEEFGLQLQAYVAGEITLEEALKNTDAKNEEILEKTN